MVAESIPIKPARLILGFIACLGLIFTLFTLLFGFTSVPANSVGVKTRFGAYHDLVNPGLAYAIPYIDEIHIVPTQRLLKLEFGFTTANSTSDLSRRHGTGGNRNHDHRRSQYRSCAVGCAVSNY